jgi:Domain of Unknown Function (DUF1080)
MKKNFILSGALILSAFNAFAQDDLTKPQTTEVWEPQPKIVTPAADNAAAPSDAMVLFDGKSFVEWENLKGKGAEWALKEGAMTVVGGKGNIKTKKTFGDCQLHVEWRSPVEPDSLKGQMKGNSGIFFQQRYEIQVLNNYQNKTYANGQATSVYKQHIPLANACRKPGEWQTYDIVFTAPRFRKNGSLERPAYVTVLHNGIITQNHVELQGATEYIGTPQYKMHGNAPIELQDHGNAVSYRNIWIREL